MSVNKFHFIGRFVYDPELRTTTNDKKVTTFRLAVDEHFKRNGEHVKETSFFDVEAWESGAEVICKYFHKGDPIYVEGSAKQKTWEDSEGKKRSSVIFRAKEFHFLPTSSPKPDNNNDQDDDDAHF